MKPTKSQLYSFRTAVASILEDFLFLNIEGIIGLIFSSICALVVIVINSLVF